MPERGCVCPKMRNVRQGIGRQTLLCEFTVATTKGAPDVGRVRMSIRVCLYIIVDARDTLK
jgi:hypothetical protein